MLIYLSHFKSLKTFSSTVNRKKMLRQAVSSLTKRGGAVHQQWRQLSNTTSSSTANSAVNSFLLRSIKDHYVEVSKMEPPPKVSPPKEFTIIKGALDTNGPVLKRQFKNEEINISVMRLANIVENDVDDDVDDDGEINQLFLHVDVSKPGRNESLNFLCGLYPDALGIHSVTIRPKTDDGLLFIPNKYNGPLFENFNEKTRDAFHNYIEERGIDEKLFQFLQAWLYVKESRNLLRWFKSVGSLVSGHEATKGIEEPKSAGDHGREAAKGS